MRSSQEVLVSSHGSAGSPIGGRLVSALLGVVLILAGCSSGAATSAPAAATGALTVEGAWARPSTGADRAGAAYLVIHNGSAADDALVGASSPVATTVEIHETTAGDSGMMAMHPVERIPIPAGGSVELKPGGYHIMLIGLTAPLEVGAEIAITLMFASAAPITVQAEVKQG
jgi:periplasmic copper chaperone A